MIYIYIYDIYIYMIYIYDKYIYILPHLFDIYPSFSLRPFVQRSTVCPAHLRRRSRGERMLRMLRTAWDYTAVAIRECQRIGSRDWLVVSTTYGYQRVYIYNWCI